MNHCRAGVHASLLLILTIAGCRTATLFQPPPVSFLSPVDSINVERSIMGAMTRRGWIATREGPGVVLGTLHVRDHTAVIRITYTTDAYQIAYVSSDNLNFSSKSNGTAVIHPNYNGWITTLIHDINAQLVPTGVGDRR